MTLYSEDGQCFIDLEDSLTVEDTEELHKELIPFLEKDQEFFVHGIDLKKFDTAGLQLIVSLKKYADQHKKTFQMSLGNKEDQLIDFYGLTYYFKESII